MKKHIYKLLSLTIILTLAFAKVDAQCIATVNSAQNVTKTATGDSAQYSDTYGKYSTYQLSPGFSYTFSGSYCTNPSICYPGIEVFLTLTDENNQFLASGVSVNYSPTSTLKVRVHQFRNAFCGAITGSGFIVYSVSAKPCPYAFRDIDGDGFGGQTDSLLVCNDVIPTGYSKNKTDCDDANKSETASKPYFPDVDGDGFGNKLGKVIYACRKPNMAVLDSTDCDDTNAKVNPNATETLNDYIDSNCDGEDGLNNAMNFDGSSDEIQTPLVVLKKNKLTIEAWVKPDLEKSNNTIMYSKNDKSDYNLFFSVNNGYLSFNFRTNVNVKGINTSPVKDQFINAKWHHVAAVIDSLDIMLYVDGKLLKKISPMMAGEVLATNTISQFISGFTYFKGDLDEYRFWNVARTETQIKNNMRFLSSKDTVGLKIYYNFNQGVANGDNVAITSISDASGKNNNGIPKTFGLTGTSSNFVNGAPKLFVPAIVVTATLSSIKKTYNTSTPTLTWPSIPNAATYCVKIYKDAALKNLVYSKCGLPEPSVKLNIDAAGNVTSARMEATDDYYYVVAGENAEGVGPFSNTGSFEVVKVITSIEEENNKNSFSIFPNPSNGTFSITSTSELGNVSVYNSLGTMVYQNTTSAKQLNIELPSKEAGIYFVKVGNKMTKLIKE